MHNDNLTVGAEQVSQNTLKVIYELTQKEFSPEAISYLLGLNVQTVTQVIDKGDFGTLHTNLDQEGTSASKTLGTTSMQSLPSSTATSTTLTSGTGLV
jgi:hypothetical protein